MLLGTFRAIKHKIFSSRRFRSGLFKGVLYVIVVGVGIIVDSLLNKCGIISFNAMTIGIMTVIALTEFFSILEHLSDFGLNIPYMEFINKYRNSIPLLSSLSKNINSMTSIPEIELILTDKCYKVYNEWIENTKCLMNILNGPNIKDSDVKLIMDVNTLKIRNKLHIMFDDPQSFDYIEYLVSLFNEIIPNSDCNFYQLANKGIMYERCQNKYRKYKKSDKAVSDNSSDTPC
jgi:hypothetical protein